MTQCRTATDGVQLVTRMLAGAPTAELELAALSEPWDSLAQAIAQVHGGRIEVSSRAGQGSHFTVSLPNKIPER